jgi:hypothetical protein
MGVEKKFQKKVVGMKKFTTFAVPNFTGLEDI